jgi:hypothetical protein
LSLLWHVIWTVLFDENWNRIWNFKNMRTWTYQWLSTSWRRMGKGGNASSNTSPLEWSALPFDYFIPALGVPSWAPEWVLEGWRREILCRNWESNRGRPYRSLSCLTAIIGQYRFVLVVRGRAREVQLQFLVSPCEIRHRDGLFSGVLRCSPFIVIVLVLRTQLPKATVIKEREDGKGALGGGGCRAVAPPPQTQDYKKTEVVGTML